MTVLGVARIWWPFIYQYGVGFVIFVTGVGLILRYRSCDLSRKQDRFWFGVLVVGFCWYMGLHLTWYMVSLYWLAPEGGGG